jgi:hypothetical protein
VTQLLDGYVSGGKLPGMIAALGWGSAPPESIARGVETKGEAAPSPWTACSASIR